MPRKIYDVEEKLVFERECLAQGKKYIAGVDEVGRGPLAGPVVCASVIMPLDDESLIMGIDDSKKLIPAAGGTIKENTVYLVDYYTEKTSGAFQIDIEPECFGGNFYIEADTLFRDTNGVDHAAQFIIPNGKIQSNFTLSMASSGDPSTFTFTVDAFPGYVNGDVTKKVMASIQVITDNSEEVVVSDVAGDKEDSKPTVVIE